MNVKHLGLLILVLLAFSANSLLCRLALLPNQETLIDPSSFTLIRLLSGAIVLSIISSLRTRSFNMPNAIHIRGAIYLFVYAAAFSFAYISLAAGTGALILFGTVQITIILVSILSGKRLNNLEWLGCFFAIAGLLVLTWADISLTQSNQLLFMLLAGIAWGLFTLNGMGSQEPIVDMSLCFMLCVPMSLVLLLASLWLQTTNITQLGIIYAVLSGALASGIGYSLWYWLLPSLTSAQAGTSQLLVPVIAAIGGAIFLNEALTFTFFIAAAITLSGVAMVIYSKQRS